LFLLFIAKISLPHHTYTIVNSRPEGHSADVDLTDRPYGLRSLKPTGQAAAPRSDLSEIVATPEVVNAPQKKDGANADGSDNASGSGSDAPGSSDSGSFQRIGDGIAGEVYGSAEVNPQFPGGIKAMQAFIKENLQYPESARSSNVRGTVLIYVVVVTDGSLKEIKVIRGLQPDLDKEALRVVKAMPVWKPGTRRGVAVNVRCIIPISVSPMK
jgi:TonB family protein